MHRCSCRRRCEQRGWEAQGPVAEIASKRSVMVSFEAEAKDLVVIGGWVFLKSPSDRSRGSGIKRREVPCAADALSSLV